MYGLRLWGFFFGLGVKSLPLNTQQKPSSLNVIKDVGIEPLMREPHVWRALGSLLEVGCRALRVWSEVFESL